MLEEVRNLKSFLFARMYRHPRVMGPMRRAQDVVTELFERLAGDPRLLPPDWAEQCNGADTAGTRRVVRDYIAGMTDNYALAEHGRATGKKVSLD
jgi:dGTPase